MCIVVGKRCTGVCTGGGGRGGGGGLSILYYLPGRISCVFTEGDLGDISPPLHLFFRFYYK